ncbi:MAG: acylneuraminate cytidylyltransferase family protein [Desulfobacterales bacterium]|nr:acylneuraminate cytidylyltransferase family protein [Desulfobacterales bacterium]
MKITALLPMKAHSERVPNKNIKNFCEKPLYHAILSTLLQSNYIDKVVINTDSDIIKEEALKKFERIVIIDRPKDLQGDFISMNNIIACDLSKIEGEHFLQTHSTNPLLKSNTIDLAIETYFNNSKQFDSLFSVTKLQTRLYWKDGSPVNHNPSELLRTQDLSPMYEENSNFYIFSKNSFVAAGKSRIGLKPQMFAISKLEAVDIDEPEDWEIAESLYRRQLNK